MHLCLSFHTGYLPRVSPRSLKKTSDVDKYFPQMESWLKLGVRNVISPMNWNWNKCNSCQISTCRADSAAHLWFNSSIASVIRLGCDQIIFYARCQRSKLSQIKQTHRGEHGTVPVLNFYIFLCGDYKPSNINTPINSGRRNSCWKSCCLWSQPPLIQPVVGAFRKHCQYPVTSSPRGSGGASKRLLSLH